MRAYVHVHVHVYVRAYVHVHVYVRAYMHACVCVCACVTMLCWKSKLESSEVLQILNSMLIAAAIGTGF